MANQQKHSVCWIRTAVYTLALIVSGLASAEVEKATPGVMAKPIDVCTSCHGKDGNPPEDMSNHPKLAGQHKSYLIKELEDFKNGDKSGRNNAIMASFAANLSEKDIQVIADFYAQQTETPGVTPDNFLTLGQQIYRGGNPKSGVPACAACHGARGNGNELMKSPKLSSQNPEYVIAQMKAFADGTRHNSPNDMMNDIAKKMTEAEITAVSHYISGLH